MSSPPAQPVVHMELHTGDLSRASAFYAELCGWRQERVEAGCGSYPALQPARGFGGGIVEGPTQRPPWLPPLEGGPIRHPPRPARRATCAKPAFSEAA